jgi:hypothetical protein
MTTYGLLQNKKMLQNQPLVALDVDQLADLHKTGPLYKEIENLGLTIIDGNSMGTA